MKPAETKIAPRDRRLPLAMVLFTQPVEITGISHPPRRLVAGQPIPQCEDKCPPLFFDPELRVVCVGDDLIPIDSGLVAKFRRAKAAKAQ